MKMLKKIILVLSLLLTGASLNAALIISPSREEISMTPGQSCEGKFTVKSDYSSPAGVKVSVRNWFMLPEDQEIAVSSWIAVKDSEFQLKPGESKDVRYQVQLSTDAKGVRVGMVSFIPQSPEEADGVTVIISASVFVTAAGTEKFDWDFAGIKVEKMQGGGLQVATSVKNHGNVHVRPKGNVRIVSKQKEVAQFDFLESRPVYPGSSRSILARSDASLILPRGKYSVLVTVNGAGKEEKGKQDFEVGPAGEILLK